MAARRATVTSTSQVFLQAPQRRSTLHQQPVSVQEECKKKQLPENFADKILELEISLDDEIVDITKIRSLLEMYMIGVEYYESIGDQRFIYFNKKMSSLMMKPNVIDSMSRQVEINHQHQPPQSPTKTKEEVQRGAEVRQKEEQIRKALVYSHQDNDEKAKVLVKTVESDIKANQKIIHDQLDIQKRTLFERLKTRRAKTLTKAYSVPIIVAETDNEDSQEETGNILNLKPVDFTSISNMIREDAEEAEDDEKQTKTIKNTAASRQLLIEIAQFKEKMLNYDSYSPVRISRKLNMIRNASNTICENKARSSSNAEYMRKRDSTAFKRNRDKQQAPSRRRHNKPSKSMDVKRNSNGNNGLNNQGQMISIEELKQQQISVEKAQKVIIQKINEDINKNNQGEQQ